MKVKIKIKLVLLLLFCWATNLLTAQNSNDVRIYNYIETYSQAALQEMFKYNIPASITMAQGILESAAGTSDLAVKARNHFGVKCRNDWRGPVFYKDDDQPNECFRVYRTVLESYEDHSMILQGKRYADLYKLDLTDYKEWAKGLKRAGYATNPHYADRLIYLIEKYHLHRLDTMQNIIQFMHSPPIVEAVKKENIKQEAAAGKHLASAQATNMEASILTHSHKMEAYPAFVSTQLDYKGFQQVEYPYTARPVFLNNGVYFVIAKKGDTFYNIAVDVQLGLGMLKLYNDVLGERYEPREGEIIYLAKKPKYASQRTYIVSQGENLRDIAQKFGCQLTTLCKLNKIDEKTTLVQGEEIQMAK